MGESPIPSRSGPSWPFLQRLTEQKKGHAATHSGHSPLSPSPALREITTASSLHLSHPTMAPVALLSPGRISSSPSSIGPLPWHVPRPQNLGAELLHDDHSAVTSNPGRSPAHCCPFALMFAGSFHPEAIAVFHHLCISRESLFRSALGCDSLDPAVF
ncbi:hypothetical protein AWENTII_009662 [Aspergillus wentii]